MIATLTAMTILATQQPTATPFALADVKLNGGVFAEATKLCADYLLELDADRLLFGFRTNAGLEPKGKKYGGWENSGLAGHTLGHFLTACAQEYARTKDKRYKDKIDYIVDELAACQVARPDGCISAIPNGDKVWEELRKGEIRSRGFDLNGLWSPWYTHHKVFAGLLDAHSMTGNKKALTVAEKFADWAIELTKGFSDKTWQDMLGTEYGGMNESLAELYARTKKEKYLTLARNFYDRRVLDPLKVKKDELQGKHSNTQIPKLVGLARLYELKGDSADRTAAEFFWETVVDHHTYAIGGNSNHEYLGPPDQLSERLSSNTAETCNTYNMLRLTRHLFAWSPNAELMDYYELAYLNHILASQSSNGMMTYFMPLVSGGARNYSNKFNDFTCCHGSGLETHTKHGDSAYFHDGKNRLWVNLFMPTTLTWKEAGVTLTQVTDFPNNPNVKIKIDKGNSKFDLLLRHPGWATGEIEFKVNGKSFTTSGKPGTYANLSRTWKAGDTIEFSLPMPLHLWRMPDNPKRAALMVGPIVLTADLGSNRGDAPRIPVLVADQEKVNDWLKPVPGKPLSFKSEGVGRPGDLSFQPFYMAKTNRYAVYFDFFDEAAWQQMEAEYRAEEARVKDMEARTIDYFRIGEMQPERDHNLKAEGNDVREANGRGFRTPMGAGWFEFDMKVDPNSPNDLVMTYWGSDRSNPEFDILIDGTLLVTETLPGRKQNQFFDATREIPEAVTKGKTTIKVRIQGKANRAAASVSGARTVRRSK